MRQLDVSLKLNGVMVLSKRSSMTIAQLGACATIAHLIAVDSLSAQ
ncbi:MAG: hypothetical protein QF898_04945 [SAR202 cluster bacterium]|nr:hypothetical protein [SAR202 cluster bacterium]MDP6514153.1 hypothetical protein [SAR202 cluster bacterium]MDP6716897.1 hypothetical protein [SAR202 cluster bacterium]